MKNNFIIMVGIPGSGKSTFAKENYPDALYISRDEVRFSIISEEDEYFSKEDKVFDTFVDKINEGLRCSKDVVADATHISYGSRLKLLGSLVDLDREKTKVIVVFMRTPLDVCIERNEKRKGTRSYVPISAIKNMYKCLTKPSFTECEGIFDEIHTIQVRR